MSKLDKAAVADVLEREYINGTATLKELASRLGVTPCALSYYGRQFFADWREHTMKRNPLCPSKT